MFVKKKKLYCKRRLSPTSWGRGWVRKACCRQKLLFSALVKEPFCYFKKKVSCFNILFPARTLNFHKAFLPTQSLGKRELPHIKKREVLFKDIHKSCSFFFFLLHTLAQRYIERSRFIYFFLEFPTICLSWEIILIASRFPPTRLFYVLQ